MPIDNGIVDILNSMPPLNTREPKLSAIGSWKDFDSTYHNLINEWIPNQPDSDQLMRLFIHLGFRVEPFIYALAGKLSKFLESEDP